MQQRCQIHERCGFGLLGAVLLGLANTAPVGAQATAVLAGTARDAATLAPLVSVQVSIPGMGIGVLTDEQGRFTLERVPAGTVEVRAESLGYETVTQSVTLAPSQTVTVEFLLSVTALSLDEMIVTVTGLQRRREVGNATTTIRVDEEIERALPPGLLSLLQGRAPDVQVLESSGSVGTAPTVTIRGSGSFLLDDTPIIYVDGTRISNDLRSGPDVGGQTTSRLSDLNLDDIESIEIVSGPSAATLYGTEAAAGVIRITTKRGRSGDPEWTLYTEVGANWDATDWPVSVWNPRSFYGEEIDGAAIFQAVLPGQFFIPVRDTLYTLSLLDGDTGSQFGTPWRTGLERSLGLSVRGGAGNVTYFLSGELTDRLGSLSNNEVRQRSLRVNLNLDPSGDVNVQVTTGFTSSSASLPNNDDDAFGYIGVGLQGFPWATPLELQDPVTGANTVSCPDAVEFQRLLLALDVPAPLDDLAGFCPENPFFEGRTFEDVATLQNEEEVERFIGGVNVQWEPRDFLVARGTIGYDQFASNTGQLVPLDTDFPFADRSLGYRVIVSSLVRGLTVEGGANLEFDLSESIRSTTALGAQFFGEKLEQTASEGRVLPPGVITVSDAVRREGFELIQESKIFGVYAQQQFGWRDRLFLTPGIRIDESSTFGDDLTRAIYPRMAVSWVVSEEPWFPFESPVTFLRLRGAYGQSGKQPAPFAALQLLGSRAVTFEGREGAAVVLVGAGNPELEPERGEEIEAGFDAQLWGNRVAVDFRAARQVTRDAFIERPISPSTGFALGQVENVGEIRNQGIGLRLNVLAVDRPSIRWGWQLILSTLDTEVTRLEEPIVFGFEGNSQRHQQGFPMSAYFSRTYSIENGQVVASDTAEFVGKPIPSWAGSLSATLELSDWIQLSALLGFAGGHQQFNGTQERRCRFLGGGEYGGICPEIYEVGPDGQRTPEARIKAAAARDVSFAPWIEDADFARLRSVSARFELPTMLLRRLRADRGSLTISGENWVLFTGYTGLDPEVNFSGGAGRNRAEFFTLPLARRLVSRLSLTF